MPNVGPLELLVVLIIALIVLGPAKLPEVGRSIGRGVREFRSALSDMGRGDEDEDAALAREEDPEELPTGADAEELPAGSGRS